MPPSTRTGCESPCKRCKPESFCEKIFPCGFSQLCRESGTLEELEIVPVTPFASWWFTELWLGKCQRTEMPGAAQSLFPVFLCSVFKLLSSGSSPSCFVLSEVSLGLGPVHGAGSAWVAAGGTGFQQPSCSPCAALAPPLPNSCAFLQPLWGPAEGVLKARQRAPSPQAATALSQERAGRDQLY